MRIRNKISEAYDDGSLTYPFRVKGDEEPRESWSPLRLKMWRHQQAVAMRLRRARKRLSADVEILASAGLGIGRPSGAELSESDRKRRAHLGEVSEMRERARAIGVPLLIYAAYCNRAGERFESATVPTVDSVIRHRLTSAGSESLRSTWVGRAGQVAREYWDAFMDKWTGLASVVTGAACAICGLPHSTFDCHTAYQSTLTRANELVVIARRRIQSANGTFNRDADAIDDIERVGRLTREIALAARVRSIGVSWWARRAATFGLKALGAGVGFSILGVAGVFEDFWYIASGHRYSLVTTANNWIEQQMFPMQGLLTYYEEEVRRSNEAVEVLQLELEAAREALRLRGIAEREAEFSTLGSIGLIDDWDVTSLTETHERRKQDTINRVFIRRAGELRELYFAQVHELSSAVVAWARGKKYPSGPARVLSGGRYDKYRMRRWLSAFTSDSADWPLIPILGSRERSPVCEPIATWLFIWCRELEGHALTDSDQWMIVSASDLVAEFLMLMDVFRYNSKGDGAWFAARASSQIFKFEIPVVERMYGRLRAIQTYGRVLRTAGVAVDQLLL